jgi:LemA protein
MIIILIILVLIVGAIGFAVMAFNKLRKADIASQEALGGIDVQLTRRAQLIPNLVATVRGYAGHEKEVLENVTAARTRVATAAQSGSVQEKGAAEAQLERALVNVMAVAENYPDLKASTNFLELQRELSDTENQLAFARQYYNDSVTTLNTLISTVPWMFFSGMAGVHRRDFFEAPGDYEQPPTIDFS